MGEYGRVTYIRQIHFLQQFLLCALLGCGDLGVDLLLGLLLFTNNTHPKSIINSMAIKMNY